MKPFVILVLAGLACAQQQQPGRRRVVRVRGRGRQIQPTAFAPGVQAPAFAAPLAPAVRTTPACPPEGLQVSTKKATGNTLYSTFCPVRSYVIEAVFIVRISVVFINLAIKKKYELRSRNRCRRMIPYVKNNSEYL